MGLLKQSKIVISPWGWGEWSHKVRGSRTQTAAKQGVGQARCANPRASCHSCSCNRHPATPGQLDALFQLVWAAKCEHPVSHGAILQDFEILMAGCVVVKPRSDIFRIHPAIFEVGAAGWSADLENAMCATIPPAMLGRHATPLLNRWRFTQQQRSAATVPEDSTKCRRTLLQQPRAPCLLQHNVTAITTKEDLSDLEDQILPFLRDIPRAQVLGDVLTWVPGAVLAWCFALCCPGCWALCSPGCLALCWPGC